MLFFTQLLEMSDWGYRQLSLLCRFTEGITDITAKSIMMVGTPREVFTEYRLSLVPTMCVVLIVFQCVHISFQSLSTF